MWNGEWYHPSIHPWNRRIEVIHPSNPSIKLLHRIPPSNPSIESLHRIPPSNLSIESIKPIHSSNSFIESLYWIHRIHGNHRIHPSIKWITNSCSHSMNEHCMFIFVFLCNVTAVSSLTNGEWMKGFFIVFPFQMLTVCSGHSVCWVSMSLCGCVLMLFVECLYWICKWFVDWCFVIECVCSLWLCMSLFCVFNVRGFDVRIRGFGVRIRGFDASDPTRSIFRIQFDGPKYWKRRI